jgi:hypothetical protein
MRMLVVTPQFAAAAGIVIAAMLAVNVPHAALTYGPNPPVRECAEQACAPAPPVRGALATSKPSIKLKTTRPKSRPATGGPAGTEGTSGPTGSPGSAGSAGAQPAVTIEYRTIRVSDSGFVAMITVKGHRKLGTWTLAFTFSGIKVQRVWGATWQPDSRGDGGVVTGQPWPWPGQKDSEARIVIFAAGAAARPASCSFDGTTCSFS